MKSICVKMLNGERANGKVSENVNADIQEYI